MKFSSKTFLTVLALTTRAALAFNAHQPFDISADVLDYKDSNQEITAEGHVIVVQTSSTLSADRVRYDRLAGQLIARGNVILHEKDAIMAGDQMDYDLTREKGIVLGAKGYGSPWLFQGASWEKIQDYYIGRHASFTTCELIDPHYHLRSSRVHLIPDRFFWAWNNVLYVNKTPVFYTPFVYKNLGPQRVVFQVQPGNDSANGTFAKTVTTVRFTDLIYDRFLFDHYTIAGNGVGNEFDYRSPGKIKGSLFGYYINPKSNPDLTGAPEAPQYNVRSYHWQQINPTTTFQSNVNLRKNISFNNQFFAQDTNQAVNDINNSIALSKTTKHFVQRLVMESQDAPDPTANSPFADVHVQNASLPRYDFTVLQRPLWSPVLVSSSIIASTGAWRGSGERIGPLQFTMAGSIGNSYFRQDDRVRQKGNVSGTFSQSIPLGRQWSLTPSFTPAVQWQDQYDPLPTTVTTSTQPVPIPIGFFKGAQARLTTSNTLRWKASSSLTLDNTYLLTGRMTPNGTSLDRSLTDGGIESHHVSTLLFWRPTRAVLMRSFSGYDLRKLADESPYLYRQRRVDPWTTELTLQPRRSQWDYFFRYQLGYWPTRDSLWETDVHYRGPYKTSLQTGLLYNAGSPGAVTWNNTLGYYFSPGWRVDMTAHALVPSVSFGTAQQATLIDVVFEVVRDMHCWEATFSYRDSVNLSKTVALMFNLKLGARAAEKIADKDLESQFYPWRANPQDQRPLEQAHDAQP